MKRVKGIKGRRKAAGAADERQRQAETTPPKAAEYVRERREIAIGQLKAAPWNPRGEIAPESVADLAASIRSLGMIQPLVAMVGQDGEATLIAGHRRLAAARLAGLDRVPCDVLVGVDEATARRMTFIENLQRRDADPLLESELVGSLVKCGMTQGEIASETGRGERWVARRLNLSRLSKSWRRRVADGERITTDCLEHIAAYPEAVQERLKKERGYGNGELRWGEIKHTFSRETQELKGAAFDRTQCRTCPNNTGCAPDLFDWDGKPAAFGRCMDGKCFRRKADGHVKAAVAAAKAAGAEVRELKEHPDYSIGLSPKRDKRHDTLYVWKDWNDETVMKWGEAPKAGKAGGGTTGDKEARKRKLAANKARRKLAEWCEGNLAGVIAAEYAVDAQVALAFQAVFNIGSSWRVFGSQTKVSDAARAYLLDPDAMDLAPMERWARLAAAEIAAKVARPEIGGMYAERLLAILPPVAEALTEEERRLVAPDETVARLREPVKVAWTSLATDAEAEDAMLTGEDGEEA